MTYVIWGFLGIKMFKSIDIEIDDESVLADGMIADSRIVKLIDELEANNEVSENTSEKFGWREKFEYVLLNE